MTTADRLRVAGADLERLELKDGDVLVLRGWDPPADPEDGPPPVDPGDVIAQFLVDHELAGVLIVYLPEGGDLDALDEEQMAAAGWVRRTG